MSEQKANYQSNTSITDSNIGISANKADVNGGIHLGDEKNINVQMVVYNENGAKVIVTPDHSTAGPSEGQAAALNDYLQYVINHNTYLQLQGIRSGGRLVHIELDRIYISLKMSGKSEPQAEAEWLENQCALAPGEQRRLAGGIARESTMLSVNEAMKQHQRLAVLGDPGSGKTTLLRYLALLFASALKQDDTALIKNKLGIDGAALLPVLIPLRQIGHFLMQRKGANDVLDGHALLLDFIGELLQSERIFLKTHFFDKWLLAGDAIILFDGLDEVADPDVRRRVSRLVESFTCAYPLCRYVVTSRIIGYTGSARLGEKYATTTIQDFTMEDIGLFLGNWHALIAVGQFGPGKQAMEYAERQTRQLISAIQENGRIRELAINPLMLTVIALVHKDLVKLPDRRAELYNEAVDVLLGKWDEARGVKEEPVLPGKTFDTRDKRLVLQDIALFMHERQQKDIDADELKNLLENAFLSILSNQRESKQSAERFLRVIEQRTGLLAARGEGVYSFSHLTFQEYLAALAIVARDDYVEYTLRHAADRWWREVILLEAGYLSTESKQKTTRLIQAIAATKNKEDVYHHLVLAAECLRDVGENRVLGNVAGHVQSELRKGLESPPSLLSRVLKRYGPKGWIDQRSRAMEALVSAGSGFWSLPHGEPEWVDVPAGKFTMGSGVDKHIVFLSDYSISKVPVTHAQYRLFVKATGYNAPDNWRDGYPPKGMESHPVIYVSWFDAVAYCAWLTEVTGKRITLPTEAQWEKAARGTDKREFPWGNNFDPFKCNSGELGLKTTTPVGIFLEGASPYGSLDMAGNVWEWVQNWYGDYPEDEASDPLGPEEGSDRVMRGGSWRDFARACRAADRDWIEPGSRYDGLGFRLVLPGQQPVTGQTGEQNGDGGRN